jgi:acyl-CoA synthetase (AMP-forming)/AMP-acid ligase II
VVAPRHGETLDEQDLFAHCRERLPGYMVPSRIDIRSGPLPRNLNGKIDRKLLASEFAEPSGPTR